MQNYNAPESDGYKPSGSRKKAAAAAAALVFAGGCFQGGILRDQGSYHPPEERQKYLDVEQTPEQRTGEMAIPGTSESFEKADNENSRIPFARKAMWSTRGCYLSQRGTINYLREEYRHRGLGVPAEVGTLITEAEALIAESDAIDGTKMWSAEQKCERDATALRKLQEAEQMLLAGLGHIKKND